MAFELVYTSAPSGIKTGATGFCVVACTRGMGPRLISVLEGLTAYKPVYPHYHANAWDNPVSCSHYIANINGAITHILSRTCFNGVDHTQRSNKLASFLTLNIQEAETAAGGPASLFLIPDMFKDASWKIEPEMFPAAKAVPRTSAACRKCTLWETLTGDAGWGGVLAERYVQNPQQPVYIVFDPLKHKNMIELLNESLALLPQELKWQVTFSSYFSTLPAGMTCTWRCCTPDADCLVSARRTPGTLIIDLTQPLPAAPDGEYTDIARTGVKKEKVQNISTIKNVDDAPLKKIAVAREPEVKPDLKIQYQDYMPDPPTHYRRKKTKKQQEQSRIFDYIKLGASIAFLVGFIVFLVVYFVNSNSKGSEKKKKEDKLESIATPDNKQEKAPEKQEDSVKVPPKEEKKEKTQEKKEAEEKPKEVKEAEKKAQEEAEKKAQEEAEKKAKEELKKKKEKNQKRLEAFRKQLDNAKKNLSAAKTQLAIVDKLKFPDAEDVKKFEDLRIKCPMLEIPKLKSEELADKLTKLKTEAEKYEQEKKSLSVQLEKLQEKTRAYAWLEGLKLFGSEKEARFYVGKGINKDDIKFFQGGEEAGQGSLGIMDNKGNTKTYIEASIQMVCLKSSRF